jgi:hypothetical protein
MGDSEIWTAWELVDPQPRTRELQGRTHTYHVGNALLHAVLMADPGKPFWPLCGPRKVALTPNWTRWEDEQEGSVIRCPECLALYPLDSTD